jgi:hypothetical protein
MFNPDSPLVETSKLRLLMSENLLKAISERCWQTEDQCVPTDYVDPSCLAEFRQLLDRIDFQLKELEAATACHA